MMQQSTSSSKVNLLGLDRTRMEAFFVEELGEKRFRAHQVMKWIYHYFADDFDKMTDLGKALRGKLAGIAEVRVPTAQVDQQSVDGTRKWLLSLDGANGIETVYIPEPTRGTLCVSSQVGCALNCRFCSTGKQGFNRDLKTAEIVGQVWHAARELGHLTHQTRRITNVVMMGMGEPLLNFDNVVPAMNIMRDDFGFGLANKRVTLSTAGVVPMIDRLSDAADVSLAVSLHAPDDALRDHLVPINRKYPIVELLEACKRYQAKRPRSSITFEYTLLKDVNDSEAQARALVKLLRKVPSKLNLIPFNPFPGTEYECPDPAVIQRFQQIVYDAGIITTLRRTRGQDIDAACGQLAGKVADRTRRSAQFRREVEERNRHAAV
ncbi:23S rRNA (adenine(2503)-C(2))-methyltransferase RlmN [Pseudofulvimonas gallinarii]|jgi:23S rRNA (adenine2503-C2)-methyltransferase|uniref:Dual-specificity RNA methyltransferase RlmN n=1 Tax=Pseudofulvimonas gallinarii TaxID=634155 RepID=A0A4R3LNE9_9GAMM|nr:23S rRNA (adenine(2503)-C(2))-methyltransferase RlmN [Pseudofulvimonas gallinarii]TCT01216.1 23S rRNA m(2)A-2503 methyltransferase [Pseudofulvimonas gallinarii]THD14982.1 23S rRNA (adenine(2503)-C(2))-methyltransferase [Pseudofulvimonas gallinarii]